MKIEAGEFYVPGAWLSEPVRVVVVGAGGSGSHVVADLAVLDQSMRDLGHPGGLQVTVIDDDTVTDANVGRAKFYAGDVGCNKADVIVHRVNVCFGLDWRAMRWRLGADSEHDVLSRCDLVIGCVDTRQSRRDIHAAFGSSRWRAEPVLWLDLGNGEWDGQVVMGHIGGEGLRLPSVVDLFPELLDASQDPTDDGPSCSRAEALMRQSAFVNRNAAMHAITMLSLLFRFGKIDHHARFFNLRTGRVGTLPCSPEAWKRFGFEPMAEEAASV